MNPGDRALKIAPRNDGQQKGNRKERVSEKNKFPGKIQNIFPKIFSKK